MMAEKYAEKKAVTTRGLCEKSHCEILSAITQGEFNATVVWHGFTPREVRKEYKQEMKKLGYRLCCDWADGASIIHIRW
jgi:hypothetical protein